MEVSGRKQIGRFGQNDEYRIPREKMKRLGRLIDETKSETDRNITISQQASDRVVQIVKQFREKLNALLDSLETKILEDVQQIKDDDLKHMSDISSKLESMKRELDETRAKMENLYATKQSKQLIVTSELAKFGMSTLEKNINDLSKANTVRKYQFHPNEILSQTIQFTQEIGSIKVEENAEQESNQNKNPVEIFHQIDIDIRQMGDEYKCNITGSVLMDNQRVAIVDESNERVSIVDIVQGRTLFHIRLDKSPYDVTYTDCHQLVVTANKYLVFLNVEEKLTVHKKVRVGRGCYGIDYINNMLIVSFTCYPGTVKFMNMDGQVMKSICTDLNGEPLFKKPYYIATNRDKNALYVTDLRKNAVIKLDMNGTVIDVYRTKYLRRPRGVTIDIYNNVYIAGCWSNNICVLTAGTRQIQAVKHTDRPQSVLCDDSDQIIVSRCYRSSSRRDVLSVYKIRR